MMARWRSGSRSEINAADLPRALAPQADLLSAKTPPRASDRWNPQAALSFFVRLNRRDPCSLDHLV